MKPKAIPILRQHPLPRSSNLLHRHLLSRLQRYVTHIPIFHLYDITPNLSFIIVVSPPLPPSHRITTLAHIRLRHLVVHESLWIQHSSARWAFACSRSSVKQVMGMWSTSSGCRWGRWAGREVGFGEVFKASSAKGVLTCVVYRI